MLSDNMIGNWSAFKGSTGYRLIDSVRGNNCTLTNTDAGTDWVGAAVRGRSGYAIDFDGTNDRAELTRAMSFSTTSFSFSIWANQNAAGIGMPIGDRTAATSYVWFRSGNYLRFSTPAGIVEFTGVTTFTGWNHAVLTGSVSANPAVSTIELYWNGIKQTSLTLTNSTFVLNTIGDGYTSQAFPFPGKIAEVAGWSAPITQADALELFRLGPGWYQPTKPRRRVRAAAAAFKAFRAKRQSQLIGGGL